MMRADGIQAAQAAVAALAETLERLRQSTEDQVPVARDVQCVPQGGRVTIRNNGIITFEPRETLESDAIKKGLSYWTEPAGGRCTCCGGTGRG